MTRIVLDADTGIDDTLALCYLLASPQAELLGIVGTYGNVTARKSVHNNRAVLRLFGHEHVPVMLGCEAPSWADVFQVDEGCARFHGSNGLGNVYPAKYNRANASGTLDTPASSPLEDGTRAATSSVSGTTHAEQSVFRRQLTLSIGGEHTSVESTPALASEAAMVGASRHGEGVQFIIDTVRQYGCDVTILATGPLTDVDAAISLAPDIVPNLRVVIMGGSLTQEGNCYDLICETNIFQDPEAANRVFRSGADVTMIGLDVTHQCLLTRADVQSWRDTGTDRGVFLADMTGFYINANEASDPIFLAGSPLHDPLAAAVALDISLVNCFDINMMTETATGNGHGFRGRTIGNPTKLRDPHKTTHVALQVDAQRFTTQLRERISALCTD